MDGEYEEIREGFCEWATAVFFLFLFLIASVPVMRFAYRDCLSAWEDIHKPACKWLMI